MQVDELKPLRACNCFALRAATRHVSQLYDQCLAPTGLRTTQFSILAKLKWKGPLTINALAAELVIDRTTLGRNVLPLQRDRLIRVEGARSDRRAKEIQLTKVGENRLRAAAQKWYEAQARFETVFGAKRAAELRGLLGAVTAIEFAAAGK
jgi:DNA-binding MarR family transcriptional regulator